MIYQDDLPCHASRKTKIAEACNLGRHFFRQFLSRKVHAQIWSSHSSYFALQSISTNVTSVEISHLHPWAREGEKESSALEKRRGRSQELTEKKRGEFVRVPSGGKIGFFARWADRAESSSESALEEIDSVNRPVILAPRSLFWSGNNVSRIRATAIDHQPFRERPRDSWYGVRPQTISLLGWSGPKTVWSLLRPEVTRGGTRYPPRCGKVEGSPGGRDPKVRGCHPPRPRLRTAAARGRGGQRGEAVRHSMISWEATEWQWNGKTVRIRYWNDFSCKIVIC